jgi:hypothetical protein
MTHEESNAPLISVWEGIIVVCSVLITPIALYVLHHAPSERILYPAVNVLLAAHLYSRRSPWYVGQCVLLFCFVPLVRRLVDVQAGWDPSNPVLLTPYLCCLLAIAGFFRYWLQRSPRYIGVFLCMLACIAYGVILAVIEGRTLAAMVDALKWSIGPIFAVYMISEADRHENMRRVIETTLVWACAAMGLYGVAQDVLMPTWDAEWMRNVAEIGLDSIGQPQPFAVRVFSTMNSPGSFGSALTAGIIVALKRPTVVAALTVPSMLIGLALCEYRTLWAATAIGVLMVVSHRRAAVPFGNVLVLFAVCIVALGTILSVPRIREGLAHRASTLTKLKSDASLEARLSQYGALARNDNLIIGEGLAISGAWRRLDKGKVEPIDGALIEIWRSMGVVVGTLFLLSMGALVGSLLCLPPSSGRHIYFDRAIVVSTFIELPMGSVHTGEMGFWAWTFLGFALATVIACRSGASQPQVASRRDRLPTPYEPADA